MSRMRGCAIGFENLVPHRQAEAEIAAAFILGARMVEAVHVGRYKKCLQAGVPPAKVEICVGKERRAAEQNFKNNNRDRMYAERDYRGGFYTQTDQRLARMESQARADIQRLLGVVGGMQRP